MSHLLYVKEDYIIPHHICFHDLIRKRAKGKSGPLFDFGVHEDVRMHSDHRIQNSESHAGRSSLNCILSILTLPWPTYQYVHGNILVFCTKQSFLHSEF